MFTHISEKSTTSVFGRFLRICRQHTSPNRWKISTVLHGVTSWKTVNLKQYSVIIIFRHFWWRSPHEMATQAQRSYSSDAFATSVLEGGGLSASCLRRFTTGNDPVHLVHEAGWAGRVRKISPPARFNPSIIQLIASRYTDYAIPAPSFLAPYEFTLPKAAKDREMAERLSFGW
jgi:hypothetical protein